MAGILRTDTIQNSNTSTIITQTNSTTITIGTTGQTVALDGGTIKSGTSTLTIGATGQTVALASGATSSGFGATYNGALNWSSTIRTTGFTAVSGTGYFCNTTAGAFTVTLPATPTAGDIVGITDYAGTAATNNITIGRNGSNIEGSASNGVIYTNRDSITLIYVDSTQGWLPVNDNTGSTLNPFVAATGGTVLTCGCYKTHIFTSSGCFVVSNAGNSSGSNSVEYIVVAGGGGAGDYGGGGGAGGFRQNYPSPASTGLPVSATTYPITVGAGGAPVAAGSAVTNGGNSIFSTITSAGGGGGSGYLGPGPSVGNGGPGGSGGGGGASAERGNGAAGTGNSPPVTPSQGNPGGSSVYTPSPFWRTGGGGGGAGGAGTNGAPYAGDAGPGGVGTPVSPTVFGPTAPSYGTPGPAPGRYFAGGGGGSFQDSPGTSHQGTGGAGGGGPGLSIPSNAGGANGTANTGGGGGGNGRSGGSGIVIIRYKFQ